MAYEINYDDKRFTEVESDKKEALSELENTYSGMINNSDKYYQAQIDASKQWADKQTQLQQEQTDFAIEQIEQQKDQAKKDYTREQSGSYVDWQKQSDQYGANAEKMADNGMLNTGYSESSQVGMYVAYQNRVATARESYNNAVLNYNNAIKDARLQNNSALAEIAYQALQQQLELSLQGFQYKNSLILEKANKKTELDNIYHQRYQDVLNQINTENALAEEVRQFNKNHALQVKEFEEGIRQFNEEIARLKAKDAKENEMEIQRLELQKAQLEEEKRQFDALHTTGGGIVNDDTTKTTKVNKPVVTNGIRGYNPKSVIQSIAEPKIANRNGDGWIVIPGYGRMSYAEVYAYVKEGKIIESKDKNGNLKYTVKKGAKL